MAQITLINPPTVLNMASLSYQNSIPPIGLAYLSGAAKAAGHSVQIIDAPGDSIEEFHPVEGSIEGLHSHGLTIAEIVRRIDPKSTMIGITHMFLHTWPLIRRLVAELKDAHPDIPIVLGGETPTAFWQHMMRDAPQIDVCALGEGETILLELIEAIESGEPWSHLHAIAHRDDDGKPVLSDGTRERQRDLESVARPDWESLDLEAYFSGGYASGVNRGRSLPMIGTRGCPYRCTFCSSPGMWTTRYVMRDPKTVVDEIEYYVNRFGIDNVDFADLTAIVNRRWILAFCNELASRDFEISWQLPTGTRSEAIDEEVSRALYRSGCRNIGYSPESGSPRMLELIKKQVNLDALEDSVEASVRAGMVTGCAIILGLPDDRWKDMWLTYKLILRLAWKGLHGVAVMIFAPYPGSELFHRLVAEGKLPLTDDYYYSALMRSGRSAVSYNDFDRRLLLAIQFFFLISFWGLQYLYRPQRLIRTLTRVFRSGEEESVMDKLLSAKLAFRKRRKEAGAPMSIALGPKAAD